VLVVVGDDDDEEVELIVELVEVVVLPLQLP